MIDVLFLVAALTSPEGNREAAEQLFTTAEREERDLDLAAALQHYDACIATDPSNRYALRATARARWLRGRSEGGFVPLLHLERVRRDPNAQRDAATVDALAHDLEGFPQGEVRVEARMFVAEAYSGLARPADAERELDQLLDEPTGDVPLRAQAASRAADLAMARGDVASARRAVARASKIDPAIIQRVERWARRRVIERGAVTILALFVIASTAAAIRRLRTKSQGSWRKGLASFLPRALLVCAYLALVAGLLANAYEEGNARPFVLVPACVLPIALLARVWALAGASSRVARVARATFSAAAVLAAAFLVLDGVDVRYLESFGL